MGRAVTFSGLGAVLLGSGSTRSWTSKPVCTGTPLEPTCCASLTPVAWMCSQSCCVQLSDFAGAAAYTASLAFILPTSQSFQLPGAHQLGGLVVGQGVKQQQV